MMENKLYTLRGFKAARKRAGLTQQQLADRLEIHIKTVRNWEQGISVPEFGTMMELCKLFNCDLDFLAGRIQEPTHDIKTVCDLTRLTPAAAEIITSKIFRQWHGKQLSRIIENRHFGDLIAELDSFYWLLERCEHFTDNDSRLDAYTINNNGTVLMTGQKAALLSIERVIAAMRHICESEFNSTAEQDEKRLNDYLSNIENTFDGL